LASNHGCEFTFGLQTMGFELMSIDGEKRSLPPSHSIQGVIK